MQIVKGHCEQTRLTFLTCFATFYYVSVDIKERMLPDPEFDKPDSSQATNTKAHHVDCRTSLAEQDFSPGVILGSALVLSTSWLFLLCSPAQAYVLS